MKKTGTTRINKKTKLINLQGTGINNPKTEVANETQMQSMDDLEARNKAYPHQLKICTLLEYKSLVEEGTIVFNNDCQRNLKCDVFFASGIVVSALNEYKMGTVVVRDHKGLDMQQRSMSLICYINNDFPLVGLTGSFAGLNGLYFYMLKPYLKDTLLNNQIVLDICDDPEGSTEHFLLWNRNQNKAKTAETFNSLFFDVYAWQKIKEIVKTKTERYYGFCKKFETDLEYEGSEFFAGLCSLLVNTKADSLYPGAQAWLESCRVAENDEVDEIIEKTLKILDIIQIYYLELASKKQSYLLGLFWSLSDLLDKNPEALDVIDSDFGSRYFNKIANNNLEQVEKLKLGNGTTSLSKLSGIKHFFDKVTDSLVNLDSVSISMED